MFQTIELKFYELRNRVTDLIDNFKNDERGQTSGEYVAVTAVAVLIAITVLYAAFTGFLSDAVSSIGSELSSWVDDEFASA